ncbi:MAG TPA: hypothetical protein PKA60_01005 [Candidatus Paceibacterota bacterium]|nr:hypothetical protein [Candidatus Paceibacterota bacterium]
MDIVYITKTGAGIIFVLLALWIFLTEARRTTPAEDPRRQKQKENDIRRSRADGNPLQASGRTQPTAENSANRSSYRRTSRREKLKGQIIKYPMLRRARQSLLLRLQKLHKPGVRFRQRGDRVYIIDTRHRRQAAA